ncbi:serine/threonine protein phosphatase PrpC [Nonomuraea polychroma]|uniref:Serine/threonine protein phosphatase PrpC n=1 Tax=Nonomuraea polychroma TaxID=46176 RepID=A0A438LXW9_9ACTN|nr:protein phosphatase 2C domain-containing protein [Nonomuraea polychroma]RVX38322.1 serine/threonine protein phosphatase PrpC [Nonomuraea polychroma]
MTGNEKVASCPVCEAPVLAGDIYCEACGHPMGAPTCASCGAGAVDAEGYCERCGLRQPTGRDHAETVLDNGAAAVTDRGLRRSRNEDAMALMASGDTIVAVVCDGVGSSPRADEASAVAVETAATALARGASQQEAFDLAGRAVAKLATSVYDAPACTYVAAVVEPDRITLGWAGDTRAYSLPDGGLLTEDDAIETGEITAWLGADAEGVTLHVRTFTPHAPGLLLVCSDGLWRYLDGYAFPSAGTPLEMAREMLRHALDSGGQDNVTIALIPLGEARE